MKKVIIYFACFQTIDSKHDRISRFTNTKPPCFFDWITEQRREIEKEEGNACVINCKIIKP